MKRTICSLICLLVLLTALPAREYRIEKERITAKDGLSSNRVNCMLQDKSGYWWIGTAEGLDRYDGYGLWNFTKSNENNPLLKGKGVVRLHEDRANNLLWVFTDNHQASCVSLATYEPVAFAAPDEADMACQRHHAGKLYLWLYGNGKNCRRVRYANEKFVTEGYKHAIRQICADEEGNDWILAENGIYLNGFEELLAESDSIRQIITYHGLCIGLSDNDIRIYNQSRRMVRKRALPVAMQWPARMAVWGDRLLLLTPQKTFVYEIIDNRFETPQDLQIKGGKIISGDIGKTIYVCGSQGEIYRLGDDGEIKKWPVSPSREMDATHPWQVVRISPTIEALATYGHGLYLYDLVSGEVTNYRQNMGGKSIDNDFITGLVADQMGCLWVLEEHIGLSKWYVDEIPSFRQYLQSSPQQAEANSLTSLTRYGGDKLCIANKRGEVYAYDIKKRQSKLLFRLQHPVKCTATDFQGRPWMGTSDGVWIGETSLEADAISPLNVGAIMATDTSCVWLGLHTGSIVKADFSAEMKLQTVTTAKGAVKGLGRDMQGRIWAVASDELLVFHPDSLEHAWRFTADDVGVPVAEFTTLQCSPSGEMWLGTHGNGLFGCTLQDGQFKSLPISVGDGLVSNHVKSISVDKQGRLWVATDEGLSLISRQSCAIRNFYFRDNPLGNLYVDNGSAFVEGYLYLATNDGFVVIDTDNVPDPDLHPNVFITSVASGEKTEYACNHPLAFDYGRNNLTFSFSSLLYSGTELVRYQYRLDGIDKEWSAPAEEHTAVYQSLPPGEYLFRVRRMYNHQHWGDEALCKVVINRPWWSNWPVILVCVAVLAILGTVSLYLWKERRRIVVLSQSGPAEEQPQMAEELPVEDSPVAVVSQRDKRFIERIRLVLDEDGCKASFSVIELGQQMGMGRTRLYTRIKEATGMTPSEYLRQWRLEKAAQMLLDTDDNIDVVRERCGFGNSTNFYNYFKRQYGMSPQKYRQSDGKTQ